ncbi:hypothetical protein ACFL0O_03425 [Thermodesulfobacteriota bacterium]
MTPERLWQPPDFSTPDTGILGEIKAILSEVYPSEEYDDLADRIGTYWISKLEKVWAEKAERIKAKDLKYNPDDPLSRIEQKTVLISYADSVRETGEPTLISLENFLQSHFPAVRGLHILPPCEMSEERFNDGGFSQISRDRIHAPYGTNAQFEGLMEKFYSMTDLVLNHVDIENPYFQKYLNGDDLAGNCFYIFSETDYQQRLARGDFEKIFRPRPFPLFTIFRRKPQTAFADLSHDRKVSVLNERYQNQGLTALPDPVINILYIFEKIKNDQMLLNGDYQYIIQFRDYLKRFAVLDPENLFVVSETQETRNAPYIFKPDIQSQEDLLSTILPGMDMPVEKARIYTKIFIASDTELFGEPIRALTTFSHVQVDLNTSTVEGLKLLVDDISWYLKMDLNMLRLDAANYAFKIWGTSCFGLPEVSKLLKLHYLSMDAVCPRNVPNLEVNAPLGNVLKQMADKEAPPPMMYDFHLAGMLPVVFNTGDARALLEIFNMIRRYEIPSESIRFSLDESHDGKSVRGSGGADPLLTYEQRKKLIDVVNNNGGHVKYKSATRRKYPPVEFKKVCAECGLNPDAALKALFKKTGDTELLYLKENIRTSADIARALMVETDTLEKDAALNFFVEKILNGREPYELCVTTRDALEKLDNPVLEVKRYMAFKTLAFALMGRNVKAVYFNDLMGLENDHELVEQTGELRNIKRTKSDRRKLDHLINDASRVEYWIAKQMNNAIALVDSDPAFHPRGKEARLKVDSGRPNVAIVHNAYENHHTAVIINTAAETETIQINLLDFGLNPHGNIVENITGTSLTNYVAKDSLELEVKPFDRFWIKNGTVEIAPHLLVEVGSEEDMKRALTVE